MCTHVAILGHVIPIAPPCMPRATLILLCCSDGTVVAETGEEGWESRDLSARWREWAWVLLGERERDEGVWLWCWMWLPWGEDGAMVRWSRSESSGIGEATTKVQPQRAVVQAQQGRPWVWCLTWGQFVYSFCYQSLSWFYWCFYGSLVKTPLDTCLR